MRWFRKREWGTGFLLGKKECIFVYLDDAGGLRCVGTELVGRLLDRLAPARFTCLCGLGMYIHFLFARG